MFVTRGHGHGHDHGHDSEQKREKNREKQNRHLKDLGCTGRRNVSDGLRLQALSTMNSNLSGNL